MKIISFEFAESVHMNPQATCNETTFYAYSIVANGQGNILSNDTIVNQFATVLFNKEFFPLNVVMLPHKRIERNARTWRALQFPPLLIVCSFFSVCSFMYYFINILFLINNNNITKWLRCTLPAAWKVRVNSKQVLFPTRGAHLRRPEKTSKEDVRSTQRPRFAVAP